MSFATAQLRSPTIAVPRDRGRRLLSSLSAPSVTDPDTPKDERMNARATVVCGRCGERHSRDDFHTLAAVRTIAGAELVDQVVHWPADVVVDVRACGRCQSPIARLART